MEKNYITDYISGLKIKATLEEVEAVQPISKQLVEDYGYSKEYIQTRPQFRVRQSPSDEKKSYPVDVAVFKTKEKREEDVYIVVECKKKVRKDGLEQLKHYLNFCNAELGIWYNGNEKIYLRKIQKKDKFIFEEIPNIPEFGVRIEDIGLYKRKDLKKTHNLKTIFKAVRNYLFANSVGTKRDEALAEQLIYLIFCKIYDEKNKKNDEIVDFRSGVNEKSEDIEKRIIDLFKKVREDKNLKNIIDKEDKIKLDKESIKYVVGELQPFCLLNSERDVIADAFETFIGHALKGEQGQFFTPRNVIKMIVEILEPKDDELIIDPACGSGGFLIDTLKYVWNNIDKKKQEYSWDDITTFNEKKNYALDYVRGIEADSFLSKVAKAYMTLIGDGTSGVCNEDSLNNIKNWKSETQNIIKLNSFDLVLTNPPFGSKIPVQGEEKLKQYDFGYNWKIDKKSNEIKKGKLKDKEAPQILFIERCLQLLKENGRMGIVLPDGILGNDGLKYIRNKILEKAKLIAVIDIPIETFQPNTGTKTSVLIIKKKKTENKNYPVFMAVCETCGHDRRGKSLEEDDIKEVPKEFKKWKQENKIDF